MSDARWATADLCDAHPNVVHPVLAVFHDFGGVRKFHGPIATLRVDEDFRPVLRELEREGRGRVLVVDGGGSLHRAILGERLLHTAARNGWAGVIVHGAIRDSVLVGGMDIGVAALATNPKPPVKLGAGEVDVPVTFGGVTFTPGRTVWCDADGVLVEV